VLRQAANYLFDTVAALAARRHDTSASAVFVWARRPAPARHPDPEHSGG